MSKFVDKSGNTLLDTNSKINEPQTEGTNGQVLTTNGSGGRTWSTVQGGGISDAPSDSKTYGRKNAAWVEIAGSNAQSNWTGRTIHFQGTSLMATQFNLESYIANALGCTCVCTRSGGSIGSEWRSAPSKIPADTDAIVIEVDANGVPNQDTISTTTEGTWFGNYNLYLTAIKECFPTIPVFLLSDWMCSSVAMDSEGRFNKYRTACEQLASKYGCIHIDCSSQQPFHYMNNKSLLVFSNIGTDDHQQKYYAASILYPFITKKINEYIPINTAVNNLSTQITENYSTTKLYKIGSFVKEDGIVYRHLYENQDIKGEWDDYYWARQDVETGIAICEGYSLKTNLPQVAGMNYLVYGNSYLPPFQQVFQWDDTENDFVRIDNPATAPALSALSLTVGDEKVLTAKIFPTSSPWQHNSWTSSNTTVASVCGGKIKALAEGTTTITVTSYHGYTATITVNVVAPE